MFCKEFCVNLDATLSQSIYVVGAFELSEMGAE